MDDRSLSRALPEQARHRRVHAAGQSGSPGCPPRKKPQLAPVLLGWLPRNRRLALKISCGAGSPAGEPAFKPAFLSHYILEETGSPETHPTTRSKCPNCEKSAMLGMWGRMASGWHPA